METETTKRPSVQIDFGSLISLYNKFYFLSRKNLSQRSLRISSFIFDNSTNPNGPHQCLLLNDSVSLVSRCRVCRKFTWTLYIQYSYRLFDFPSTIDAICHQYHTLVKHGGFFPSTSFYFSLIQQLVLESQHKKRCDQMMPQ